MILTDPPYNVGYVGKTRDALTIANDRFDGTGEFAGFLGSALGSARDMLRDGGAFYVFYASSQSQELMQALVQACMQAGLVHRQVLVWVKNTLVLGHMDYQNQYEPCLYGWKDGAAHTFAPTKCETTVIEDRPDLRHMTKPELVDLCERLMEPDAETDVIRCDKPVSSAIHPTMKPVRLFARLIRNSSRPGDVVLDPFGGSGTTVVACEQMGRSARTVELDPRYCDAIVERWERLTGRRAEKVGDAG